MKTKKLSLYSKVLISVVIAFVVLLVAAVLLLWNWLSAYEGSQPKYVANSIFQKYFVTLDIEGLNNSCKNQELPFETSDFVKSEISKLYDSSKFQLFRIGTKQNGDEEYAVAFNNKQIANFVLSASNEKDKYGFTGYFLSSYSFDFSYNRDVVVKVPKNAAVYLNGIKASDDYIAEKDIEHSSYKYMPEGVEGIKFDKYVVKGFMFEPEIEVKTADDKALELEYIEAEQCFAPKMIYNEEYKKLYSDYVLAAGEEYVKYCSDDGEFSSVAKYLDKSSEIYARVRALQPQWVMPHNGCKIISRKASEFYTYSDNVFSCRIQIKQNLIGNNSKVHTHNVDVIFYLKKQGNKFVIYEILTN